ncbi:pectate lyase family protein [Paludisphaera rhizosphaerae]|uniref:pectate lyase family protein n=1 Tax=Paludisphaera rhizosphaerae TaxID=2711216 RepID=UPI0013EA5061|nr:pectate lyase [Paludisphaera rhizosphaerae]
MKSASIGFLVASLVLIGSRAVAAQVDWETPPGWTDTRGGGDGKVIRVTTLAAGGPGSLAEALAADGPRVIEFAVGGKIEMGGRSLKVARPFVTIAGETAPTPGITITDGGMGITTHDVIVRHLRIRPGASARERKSGWEVDGLTTADGAHDVIVDHCSLTWATDENLNASGPRFDGANPDEWRKNTSHRVTFSHCIIGEGLHNSTHAKGKHSKGSLVHDNATEIAIIGNLYISNDDRNPLFKGGARGAVVNNLIHNPGGRVMQYALNPGEWSGHDWQRGAIVIVGNVAKKGPSTSSKTVFLDGRGPCDVYLKDNLYFDKKGGELPTAPVFTDVTPAPAPTSPSTPREPRIAEEPMFWPPRLKALSAAETSVWVLANAGARAWDRDATDRRLIDEANSGGGKIIDFESEVPESTGPGR